MLLSVLEDLLEDDDQMIVDDQSDEFPVLAIALAIGYV